VACQQQLQLLLLVRWQSSSDSIIIRFEVL
jgi:hypothetical protein